MVPIIPFGIGLPLFQVRSYGAIAFGRDLMMALMLGALCYWSVPHGAAPYQTGAAAGRIASAWFYAFQADFMANGIVAAALLGLSGFMLENITCINTPITVDI